MLGVDMTFLTNALTIAVQVIAILEAIKKFMTAKLPAWAYIIISAIVSLVLGYIPEQIRLAVFSFCLAELFYDSIWKAMKNKLEGNNKRSRNECGESERDC